MSVCMSNKILIFALNDPKTYIWIDLVFNTSANEGIVITRSNMATKHGILSLIRADTVV